MHQPELRLFNTEQRLKERIVPSEGDTIRMYTCGPTVYNYAHIGNFRTYVFEDLLRRTLHWFGMRVVQVMNLTDVEDKIIKMALEAGLSVQELTKPYIEAFFQDLGTLRIEPAEFYPKATDHIPKMVSIIQGLMEKGMAYRGRDGSVYFSVRHFPSYGRLSHLHLDELKVGASERLFADEYAKEEASDFVLWKSYDPQRDGKIFWESPLGRGRPGWHIECSAMAMELLGPSIDIHVGGVDNIFPHHENEIAQSEAFSGVRFVRYWLHSEHLLVDHRKMSKSLGNMYTLRELLQMGYTGAQIRYLLMQTHYRVQLNFTFQGLQAAGAALQRLEDCVDRLRKIEGGRSAGQVSPLLVRAEEAFASALADDLNVPAALAVLFEMVRQVHVLCDAHQMDREEAAACLTLLERLDGVLGVLSLQQQEVVPLELQEALQRRERARLEKSWAAADAEREWIQARGYQIEDTPMGPRLKRIPTPRRT